MLEFAEKEGGALLILTPIISHHFWLKTQETLRNQIHSNSTFNRKNDLDSQNSISLRCYDLTTLYIIVDSTGSQFLSLRDLTLAPPPLFFFFLGNNNWLQKEKGVIET